jgi:hypothetical protein
MLSSRIDRRSIVLPLFLCLAGCAASSDEEPENASAALGAFPIHPPQGVYFADVRANGSGCPAGSWDAAIADDGETFTLTFSQYEAQVSSGKLTDGKNCAIDIQLRSPRPLSYSIATFYYQGYVFLEKPGMLAQHRASYGFDGDPITNADSNAFLGPRDKSYIFASNVPIDQRAWSPCTRSDVLHVRTAINVRNDNFASGSGYLNNSTVDGALRFKWRLVTRRCD